MSARVSESWHWRWARLGARLRGLATHAGMPVRKVEDRKIDGGMVRLHKAEPKALARAVMDARRSIGAFFPEELFADPVRDLLIELYAAGEARAPVPVTSACNAAAVPVTTALRCIELLKARGLVLVENDKRDGRPILLRLSADAHRQMEHYLADVAARLARAVPAPAVPR